MSVLKENRVHSASQPSTETEWSHAISTQPRPAGFPDASIASPGGSAWSRRAIEVVLGLLTIVVFILAWRSLAWPLVHDAAVMHYVGWLIAGGAVPYRDIVELNFPGTYLVHLFVLRMLGAGDLAFRVFDLAWLAGTAVLIAVYGRRLGVRAAWAAALLFGAYHLVGGPAQAGQRDYLMVGFLVAAAHCVEGFRQDRRLLTLATLGGLWLGAAMMIKPTVLVFGVALFLAGVTVRWQQWAKGVLAGIVGALLVPAAVLTWLGWVDGLASFVEVVWRYSRLYASLERLSVSELLLRMPIGRVDLVILAMAAVSVAWSLVGRRADSHLLIPLVGLGYGLLHYLIHGKGYSHHLYPVMAFACLLAAFPLGLRFERGGNAARVAVLAGLTVLTLALGTRALHTNPGSPGDGWVRARQERVQALVRRLEGRVSTGASVLLLDNNGGGHRALMILGIRQATRLFYEFPLYYGEPSSVQRLRAEFLRDLRRRPPQFVMLSERAWPRGGYERLRSFPEFLAWLEGEYSLDWIGHGYRIYVRRNRADERGGALDERPLASLEITDRAAGAAMEATRSHNLHGPGSSGAEAPTANMPAGGDSHGTWVRRFAGAGSLASARSSTSSCLA